jgi:hypothetical protein
MTEQQYEAITQIFADRIAKEKSEHPMGMSQILTTACKIGRAIKELDPEFNLDAFYDAIGNERYMKGVK